MNTHAALITEISKLSARERKLIAHMDMAAHLGTGREKAVKALEHAGFAKTGEFQHSVNFRHATGEPVRLAFDADFDAMIERAQRLSRSRGKSTQLSCASSRDGESHTLRRERTSSTTSNASTIRCS